MPKRKAAVIDEDADSSVDEEIFVVKCAMGSVLKRKSLLQAV